MRKLDGWMERTTTTGQTFVLGVWNICLKGAKTFCNQKREGARPNNTMSYCKGLSNVVIYELLWQNTTTDPFPHTSSLSIPVCILWSTSRHSFYLCKLAKHNFRNQNSYLVFHRIRLTAQASSLQYAHQNQTSYSAKLLAQRKISTAQPSSSTEQISRAIYLCIFELIWHLRLYSSIPNTKLKAKNSSPVLPQPLAIL